MQQLVDIGIGPAGDVWVTNNWDVDAAAFGQASEALSTRGAGQGVVVFYGMAKPVHGKAGEDTADRAAACALVWQARPNRSET
jgi:hypothetical protein